MKWIGILALVGLALADKCPQDKEIECITDVNHALDLCDKAAKEKGKDQTADINCIKYLASVEQDCWPCICQIAIDNGYKIKGCTSSNKITS
jgi:hypothetical protein